MGNFHDLMDREMRIRGLTENTRKGYLGHMRCFVRHFMLPPDQLSVEHVKQYQLFLAKDRGVSYKTFNCHVSAIRFFYKYVLDLGWNAERIPYQKTGKSLPIVLSREEVLGLFDVVTNLKHRTILMVL
jgi:integrase/recombinase XerD